LQHAAPSHQIIPLQVDILQVAGATGGVVGPSAVEHAVSSETTPQLSPAARAFAQWLIRKDIGDTPLGTT
jgi:hypothetical protein